jgi:hypothetical protein
MADDKTLEAIKRLLVLLLIKLDATSEELAIALQTDSGKSAPDDPDALGEARR